MKKKLDRKHTFLVTAVFDKGVTKADALRLAKDSLVGTYSATWTPDGPEDMVVRAIKRAKDEG